MCERVREFKMWVKKGSLPDPLLLRLLLACPSCDLASPAPGAPTPVAVSAAVDSSSSKAADLALDVPPTIFTQRGQS